MQEDQQVVLLNSEIHAPNCLRGEVILTEEEFELLQKQVSPNFRFFEVFEGLSEPGGNVFPFCPKKTKNPGGFHPHGGGGIKEGGGGKVFAAHGAVNNHSNTPPDHPSQSPPFSTHAGLNPLSYPSVGGNEKKGEQNIYGFNPISAPEHNTIKDRNRRVKKIPCKYKDAKKVGYTATGMFEPEIPDSFDQNVEKSASNEMGKSFSSLISRDTDLRDVKGIAEDATSLENPFFSCNFSSLQHQQQQKQHGEWEDMDSEGITALKNPTGYPSKATQSQKMETISPLEQSPLPFPPNLSLESEEAGENSDSTHRQERRGVESNESSLSPAGGGESGLITSVMHMAPKMLQKTEATTKQASSPRYSHSHYNDVKHASIEDDILEDKGKSLDLSSAGNVSLAADSTAVTAMRGKQPSKYSSNRGIAPTQPLLPQSSWSSDPASDQRNSMLATSPDLTHTQPPSKAYHTGFTASSELSSVNTRGVAYSKQPENTHKRSRKTFGSSGGQATSHPPHAPQFLEGVDPVTYLLPPSSNSPRLGGGGDWREAFKRILKLLKQKEASRWFLTPVDPISDGVPDYHKVIKHPMDFYTIEKKLSTAYIYNNPYAVQRDFRQVFYNAFRYHYVGNEVWTDAYDLAREFEMICRGTPEVNPLRFTALTEGDVPPNPPRMMKGGDIMDDGRLGLSGGAEISGISGSLPPTSGSRYGSSSDIGGGTARRRTQANTRGSSYKRSADTTMISPDGGGMISWDTRKITYTGKKGGIAKKGKPGRKVISTPVSPPLSSGGGAAYIHGGSPLGTGVVGKKAKKGAHSGGAMTQHPHTHKTSASSDVGVGSSYVAGGVSAYSKLLPAGPSHGPGRPRGSTQAGYHRGGSAAPQVGQVVGGCETGRKRRDPQQVTHIGGFSRGNSSGIVSGYNPPADQASYERPSWGVVPDAPPEQKIGINDKSLNGSQRAMLLSNLSRLAPNQRCAALELVQDDLGILAENHADDVNFWFDTELLSIEKQKRIYLYVNQMVRANKEESMRQQGGLPHAIYRKGSGEGGLAHSSSRVSPYSRGGGDLTAGGLQSGDFSEAGRTGMRHKQSCGSPSTSQISNNTSSYHAQSMGGCHNISKGDEFSRRPQHMKRSYGGNHAGSSSDGSSGGSDSSSSSCSSSTSSSGDSSSDSDSSEHEAVSRQNRLGGGVVVPNPNAVNGHGNAKKSGESPLPSAFVGAGWGGGGPQGGRHSQSLRYDVQGVGKVINAGSSTSPSQYAQRGLHISRQFSHTETSYHEERRDAANPTAVGGSVNGGNNATTSGPPYAHAEQDISPSQQYYNGQQPLVGSYQGEEDGGVSSKAVPVNSFLIAGPNASGGGSALFSNESVSVGGKGEDDSDNTSSGFYQRIGITVPGSSHGYGVGVGGEGSFANYINSDGASTTNNRFAARAANGASAAYDGGTLSVGRGSSVGKSSGSLPAYTPVPEEGVPLQIEEAVMGRHADFLGRIEGLGSTHATPSSSTSGRDGSKQTAWPEWKGQVIKQGMVSQREGAPMRTRDELIAEGYDARI